MSRGDSALGRILRQGVRIGWKLAVVAAVVAIVVYRLRFAPVAVESRAAANGPIVAEVMGTGTLEPRVQATISAKISGRIAEVRADQGDRVTKGQLLASLDDGDWRAQVEIAKADLATAKAGVDRAAAEVARAEAAAVLARSDLRRVTEMQRMAAAAPYELDQATERRDAAEAELKRAQLARIEVERQAAKSEQALRYDEERLTDTRIISPFDGLVVRRSREEGDVVVPGSPILQVVSTDQMWISAWVDESAMAALAVGQPARAVFRSEPAATYSGAVTRISPLADRETREFVVDVTLKELPRTWAVGQRAEVFIRTASREDALVIPQRAIIWQQGKAGVFVDVAGKARWRPVSLGLRGADAVEVTDGLRQREVVLWPKDPKGGPLTDGRAVKPTKAVTPLDRGGTP